MTDVNKEAFGAALKEYRRTANLTQRKLARLLTDALGVDDDIVAQSVSAWETGRWLPDDRRTVEALESVLTVPDQTLLRYAGYVIDPGDWRGQIEQQIDELAARLGGQVQDVARGLLEVQRALAELMERDRRTGPGEAGGVRRDPRNNH